MIEKNIESKLFKNISTWRRISMATWDKPRDPSVYGVLEIDMTKALPFMEDLKQKTGQKITITHLMVKAMAKTLKQHPELNVFIRRNRIYLRDHVDVFVQVFCKEDEKPDLSGAKIRDGHLKSITQIAAELVNQSTKIRKGDDPNLKQSKKSMRFLTPRLLRWFIKFVGFIGYELNIRLSFLKLPPDPFGAVMITNVGVFGLKMGWAPLVPYSRTPMVMATGEITKQAMVENDQVVIKPILNIGIVADHRTIDGYIAGKCAATFRDLLENPEQLLP